MKPAIRQRALELGFDACRFTTAAAPETGPYFLRWLAAGQHGEMAYLQNNAAKRVDPQRVLPGAKSLIMLAASYGCRDPMTSLRRPDAGKNGLRSTLTRLTGTPELPTARSAFLPPSPPSSRAFIARYARLTDYHTVLGERLKCLSDGINQLGGNGTRSLGYVDTGPLLERDLAQRAGLGFVGKHTNLISRPWGNWLLLAEVLTTLELEPDAPEKNRCGSCTRCLAACPTQAIIAPFQLDARRCISYLTIELKGSIPEELRPAIGNRIFGCDDCLAVCPWNRFAQAGRLMQDHQRHDLAEPDLLELIALDEVGFRTRFAGTPLQRLQRRRLLRNTAIALGNVGQASALPALSRAVLDPDSLIAEHAQWALRQIHRRLTQSVPMANF